MFPSLCTSARKGAERRTEQDLISGLTKVDSGSKLSVFRAFPPTTIGAAFFCRRGSSCTFSTRESPGCKRNKGENALRHKSPGSRTCVRGVHTRPSVVHTYPVANIHLHPPSPLSPALRRMALAVVAMLPLPLVAPLALAATVVAALPLAVVTPLRLSVVAPLTVAVAVAVAVGEPCLSVLVRAHRRGRAAPARRAARAVAPLAPVCIRTLPAPCRHADAQIVRSQHFDGQQKVKLYAKRRESSKAQNLLFSALKPQTESKTQWERASRLRASA